MDMVHANSPDATKHTPHAQAPVQQRFHAPFACTACAEAIAQMLRANSAVADVQINYAARTVEVTYQPEQITPSAI